MNLHEAWINIISTAGYLHDIGKIGVADAFDTIISKRTYKESRSSDFALEEIVKAGGTQFDPQIVNSFCSISHDFCTSLDKCHETANT